MSSIVKPGRLLPAICALLLCSAPFASAATVVFFDTTGDGLWNTAANWTDGNLPGTGDTAVVNRGRAATVASPAALVNAAGDVLQTAGAVTVNNALQVAGTNAGAGTETLRHTGLADLIPGADRVFARLAVQHQP